MGDANENLGAGGGQPPMGPLGGPSLDAEEKAMRKGKGRMLAGMITAVVAVIALAVVFLASGGEAEAYRQFGRNINGLEQEHFDQFWGCALRGVNLADIRDNEALMAQIDLRGVQGGKRYVAHVRDNCMEHLSELRPKLDALIPPEDMRQDVNQLAEATSQLRSAWSNFIAHVDSADSYDSEAAREPITQIARGWYDFRRIHGRINSKIREKIGR